LQEKIKTLEAQQKLLKTKTDFFKAQLNLLWAAGQLN
jgi:outer membrane protein TolC